MASSSAGSSNLDLPISGVGANRAGSQSSSPLTGSYAGSLGSNGIGNNGAAAANNYTTTSSPLPAGHQQDLNYLYEQIQELSKFLQANRAKTAELTQMAQVAQVSLVLHVMRMKCTDYCSKCSEPTSLPTIPTVLPVLLKRRPKIKKVLFRAIVSVPEHLQPGRAPVLAISILTSPFRSTHPRTRA